MVEGLLVAQREGRPGLQALLVTSPDGIHWRYADDTPEWHPLGADPLAYVYWNP
jgi:hypothetical protein